MGIDLVVIGSSNTDMVIRTPRIPKPGETVLGGTFLTLPGGKGANQAVASSRAGGNVTFIARIGRDAFGDRAVEDLRSEGIQVDYIVRDADTPSGVGMVFVDDSGENSIAVASGSNARMSPEDVEKAGDVIRKADLVLLQLEIPLDTVRAAVEIAATSGSRIILNPAPAQALPDELLRHVTVLTPNESEAEIITGITIDGEASAAEAARALRAKGVGTAIVTMGRRGAFVSSPEFEGLIRGYEVTAVDSTGAGDVFNGALAVSLAESMPLPEAVRFANAAAALSVTRIGAQPSAPERREIDAFLR
jgi:ribokinase